MPGIMWVLLGGGIFALVVIMILLKEVLGSEIKEGRVKVIMIAFGVILAFTALVIVALIALSGPTAAG